MRGLSDITSTIYIQAVAYSLLSSTAGSFISSTAGPDLIISMGPKKRKGGGEKGE
ncbi:MAG: hypothetical protein ACI9SP_002347 [Arenicella sp.]|jgi:hypothetical protein